MTSTSDSTVAEVAGRYRRLAAAVTGKIEQVPADRWSSQSPCEDWSARDVVRHLIDVHSRFLGLVGRTLEPGPEDVDTNPLRAWVSARDQLQRNLDDPQLAGQEFEGVAGRSTFAAAVDRFVCFDLNIHGWDLARATGLDARIDPAELPRLWETAESFGDAIRSANVCGPPVEPPDDADEQSRLLAYLGRRP
jgi:uncharacterized protein (TIGR03086 family)